MVRLIMGDNGAGKTKQLIGLVHASVAEEGGCVVCIEPGADMTYDIKSSVRLVNAGEYHLDSFECLRGFISGLYAGNYDISHVYVDNLCKIVHSEDFAAVEKFLHWLDKFSDANTVKFTVTLTADASVATEGMRKYLYPNQVKKSAGLCLADFLWSAENQRFYAIAPGRNSIPELLLLSDFWGQLRCFFLPSSRAAAASRDTEAAASHRAV